MCRPLAELPWNKNLAEVPIGTPVLFRLKDKESIPFMATREDDSEDFDVNICLGPDEAHYGITYPFEVLDCFLEVY